MNSMIRNRLNPSRFGSDDRGVTEVLGYVLLLGVVFIAVGTVFLLGVPIIEEQQESEYMSNTVRAFEVFSNNLDAIERDRSPSRETEIRYQGGTVFQTEDLFMEMDIEHDGDTENHFFASTPLSYAKGDTSVHYEGGAVIRQDPGADTMVAKPPFDFSDDRTRLSVVTTTVREDEQALSGTGELVIVARGEGSRTTTTLGSDSSEPVDVEVTVTSPRYEGWEAYFEEEGLTVEEVDHTNETVTVSFRTDQLAVRETLITLDARS